MAGDAGGRRFLAGSVFVGREWELAQLRAAFSEAQAGRGQLYLVSGEAGIGKTRLVGKLASLAEGEQGRVLWGRCWEGEEAPAFWPWIQIFRNMVFGLDLNALVGTVGQSPPDLARLIPEFKGLPPNADALSYPPSDQERFRLFDAAAMSIRTAAAAGPLVLILEDLHEADRSSLLLLEFVTRQLYDIPLLVLATSREPEADLKVAVRDVLATIAGSGHRIPLTDPYRFAHALVRETLYQDLPAEQRWRLHRRVGRAIETLHRSDLDRYLDHLAHHFSATAALGELDRAIEYSQRAGQRATRQFGYDEAIRHYRRALELAQAATNTAPKRFDLLLALGDAHWWAGHVCEASETFQSAALLARESEDPYRLAEAALRVGEVGYGGAYMEAWSFDPVKADILDEALAALGEQESLLKVRVLARLATALYFSPCDSLARRESSTRASVELARRLGDGPALAYALHARHLAVWAPDNLEERVSLSAEIIELAQQAGDASLEITGHVWQLADLFEIGDIPGADREIDTHESLAAQVGYPHFIAHGLMFRATQAMLRGEFADAEALAQRSLALGEQVGDANVSDLQPANIPRNSQGW